MMPEILIKNLQQLALFNPKLAALLPTIDCHPPQTHFLHSPLSAQQEAEEWFNTLSLQNIQVLYVYGIGTGHYYEAALPWLEESQDHQLVFLEDDLAVIRFLLETERGTAILQNLQVDIQDVSQIEKDHSIISSIVQDHLLKNYCFTALLSYQKERSSFYALLGDQIAYETAEQDVRAREMANFGLAFFNNFYRNLLKLPESYNGTALIGKFKGIPAIICGAGPSLSQSLPLLKDLKNRTLLFAPGSALNILSAHEIEPHFGVHLDPTEETLHRLITNRAFEVSIFYQNRLYHEALPAIHGPRLFLPGTSHYRLPDWFEEQLHINFRPIESGYNSVHKALAIAYELGCNPIILVGLDLASRPGQQYASGIESYPLYPFKIDYKAFMGNPVKIEDKQGRSALTFWPWIIEAQWIDVFHRLHPDVTLLNATEGGIHLFSVPECSLKEVTERDSTSHRDLAHLVHRKIQEAGLVPVNSAQIIHCIQIFSENLKKCLSLCQRVLLQGRATKIVEESLSKEIGFIFLLQQFDDFYRNFTQKDRRMSERLSREERDNQIINLDQERDVFLIQTIKIHLKIIENALNENASSTAIPFHVEGPAKHQETEDVSLESSQEEKKEYYQSGALYSCQIYENHLREGKQRYYYPNGTIKTEMDYHLGRLDGMVRLYYPNGQLKRELSFRAGKRDGIERSWNERGQQFTEIHYQDNEAKMARCWLSDGTLAKEIFL